MMGRAYYLGLAAAFLLTAAACSGGTSTSSLTPASGTSAASRIQSPAQGRSPSKRALDAVDAFGAHAKALVNDNVMQLVTTAATRRLRAGKPAPGCTDGVVFYSPDRNGDPNSNETLYYYNAHCTQLALDAVNLNTSTGTNSETVQTTAKSYAKGKPSTPTATVTATSGISNATFDSNGLPIVADGFNSTTAAQLSMGGVETIANDDELLVAPSTTSVSAFCGDAAGYNVAGIQSLSATFGWQGGAFSNATRTVNADGSVTWAATATGNIVEGPIGSLSIAQGAANTACPIVTPQFTISGGTNQGSFSIPMSLTFRNGVLNDASVTAATLPNGDVLDVETSAHKHPGNPNFIRGTVTNDGKQVAKFGLDAFGNGQLIVLGGGDYKIVDWTVVQ